MRTLTPLNQSFEIQMYNGQDFEKWGGHGQKVQEARKNISCHKNWLLLYNFCSAFLRQFVYFKRVFASYVDFDDSIHETNETVVLIFLFYRNWFYHSESVVSIVGSLSFCSHSIFLAF